MTCENCIHFDICNENADGNIVELMKEPCFRFMDKDSIVRLPCKIGDVVYIVRACTCYTSRNKDGKWSNPYAGKRCSEKVYLGIKRRKHHCGYVASAKFELKHLSGFGKNVFLTKEEAEKALGERKEDG